MAVEGIIGYPNPGAQAVNPLQSTTEVPRHSAKAGALWKPPPVAVMFNKRTRGGSLLFSGF